MGVEPLEERVVEVREREHDGDHGVGHVLGVFYAWRDGGVGGEREDQGVDGGRVGRQERVEEGSVLWGGENGDGKVVGGGGELMG